MPRTNPYSTESRQDFSTPSWFVEEVVCRKKKKFILDVCCSGWNACADKFYTLNENGLVQPWQDDFFCNPPWNSIMEWALKGKSEKKFGVYLVPVRPETEWWRELVSFSYMVEFIYPRLNYFVKDYPRTDKNKNPYLFTGILPGIAVSSALIWTGTKSDYERIIYTYSQYVRPRGANR